MFILTWRPVPGESALKICRGRMRLSVLRGETGFVPGWLEKMVPAGFLSGIFITFVMHFTHTGITFFHSCSTRLSPGTAPGFFFYHGLPLAARIRPIIFETISQSRTKRFLVAAVGCFIFTASISHLVGRVNLPQLSPGHRLELINSFPRQLLPEKGRKLHRSGG